MLLLLHIISIYMTCFGYMKFPPWLKDRPDVQD